MKTAKITFWVSTTIIFLFESVASALTSHSQLAIQGITSLGYPVYFVTILMVFKVLGGLALMIPKVPGRVKEWAYAGFAIDFICAATSIVIVMGFSLSGVILPIICMILLVLSYTSYHKLHPYAGK